MSTINRKPKTELLASLLNALRKSMKAAELGIPANESNDYFSAQRRDFLKKTGKAVAAVGLLGIMEGCRKAIETITPYDLETAVATRNSGTAPRIAIIGAGIAGLHAAFILK